VFERLATPGLMVFGGRASHPVGGPAQSRVLAGLQRDGGRALAMAGRLDPIAAAILMPLSSVTVILSSYRARTFRARATPRGDAPCR